jgi:hypothetical protein
MLRSGTDSPGEEPGENYGDRCRTEAVISRTASP